jgi:hypothetical protein
MSRPVRNPYQGLFLGHFAQKYEEIASYTAEELVTANFNAIQALLAWEMSDQRQFDGEKRTLAAAVAVLVEQEQISQPFAEYVQVLLRGWSLERLAAIAGQAQMLPITAQKLRQDGDLAAQAKILQDFMLAVLTQSDDREIRSLGMNTLQQLKLAGGMSQESLNRMLALVEAASTGEEEEFDDEDEDEDEEPEPEEVDIDAVDVEGDVWEDE